MTFQVELEYQNSARMRFLRVARVAVPVVTNRKVVENAKVNTDLNLVIPALAGIRRSAALGAQGKYIDARTSLVSTLRLVQRCMRTPSAQRVYISFVRQAERLDAFMREKIAQEETFKLHNQKVASVAEKKDDYIIRNIERARKMSKAEFLSE